MDGQGFGDLLIKSGVGLKVTWVTGLPKEMELGFGVGSGNGAQELCPRVPTRQNQVTEQETGNRAPDRVWQHLLALRHHGKHLGGAEWMLRVTHKLQVRLGEGSLGRRYVMMG